MSQETNDSPTTCLCSNVACQCPIEVLRDLAMQALQLASREDVSDERLRFFPRESVLREISPEFVRKVLRKVPNTNVDIAEGLHRATNRVCPRGDCCCKRPLCTGNRIVFVSLLFTGLHNILGQFLHAAQLEYCDSSLWGLSQNVLTFGGENPIFRDIQRLNGDQKQLFLYWAHQLRALCFLKEGDDAQVRKLGPEDGVENRVRLPWTSIESPVRSSGGESHQGANKPQVIDMQSSRVQKIYIHRSHHKLDESTNRFALKTFLDGYSPGSSQKNFDLELETNNAIRRHDRILALLAALEHRGNFYMIFPWAEFGNLRGIWEEYSPRVDGATGPNVRHAEWYSSQWILEQCLGIASAVAYIHGRGGLRQFLLHADITPVNILGFPNQHSVFLKLADFGHSHILDPDSLQVPVSALVKPRTYRAPEWDTKENVTTQYDVWSLGCLFLEFATWAISGREGIKAFENERLSEDNDPKADYGSCPEDTFFKRVAGRRSILSGSRFHRSYMLTTHRNDSKSSFTRSRSFSVHGFNRPVVTQIREAVVAHIQDLRNKPECNDDCGKRAWSDEVRDALSRILSKGLELEANHVGTDRADN
ncbi:kinase-like protein [Apiospora arundinis]|uniref:Kinase-like protein n=1 Tax=Apiospora arundinis TaxID=335852 RepID=A0ABR2IIB6_9PEZI